MKAEFHRDFVKAYKALPVSIRVKFKERLATFMADPYDSALRNHPLKGKYGGYRSINVTGDVRAIYCLKGNDTAYFVVIGTHAKLYR